MEFLHMPKKLNGLSDRVLSYWFQTRKSSDTSAGRKIDRWFYSCIACLSCVKTYELTMIWGVLPPILSLAIVDLKSNRFMLEIRRWSLKISWEAWGCQVDMSCLCLDNLLKPESLWLTHQRQDTPPNIRWKNVHPFEDNYSNITTIQQLNMKDHHSLYYETC